MFLSLLFQVLLIIVDLQLFSIVFNFSLWLFFICNYYHTFTLMDYSYFLWRFFSVDYFFPSIFQIIIPFVSLQLYSSSLNLTVNTFRWILLSVTLSLVFTFYYFHLFYGFLYSYECSGSLLYFKLWCFKIFLVVITLLFHFSKLFLLVLWYFIDHYFSLIFSFYSHLCLQTFMYLISTCINHLWSFNFYDFSFFFFLIFLFVILYINYCRSIIFNYNRKSLFSWSNFFPRARPHVYVLRHVLATYEQRVTEQAVNVL